MFYGELFSPWCAGWMWDGHVHRRSVWCCQTTGETLLPAFRAADAREGPAQVLTSHHITSQKISWSSDYCQRNVIEACSKNRNSKVKSYSRVSAGLKKSYFHKLKALKSEQKVLKSWSRRGIKYYMHCKK